MSGTAGPAAAVEPDQAARRRASASRWVPGFLAAAVIWGSSFALIKVAVDAGVAPVWVAFWRCVFGALALWVVCAAQRSRLPRDPRTWGHAAVIALLQNAIPFVLFAFGETKISSLLAGMWNATTPLTTLVFVLVLVRAERPNLRRLCGLLVGFLGVAVLLEVWRGMSGDLLVGSLACLGATTGYGAGFAYIRRFFAHRPESASMLSAIQISFAAVELAVVAPLAGGAPSWPGPLAVGCLVLLGALGTGVAFILNLRVIRLAGPTVASTVTYLTPVWSTLLGAVLLAEPVGWFTVAGGLLVILGVVFTRAPTRAAAPLVARS